MMKKIIPLLLTLFLLVNYSCKRQEFELKVITFNVRLDLESDAPNNWSNRLPVVADYLKAEMPDIMGVQEAFFHQNEDIIKEVPGYAYLGTGRTDGKKEGEYSSVFYRTEIFEMLDQSQFWLSETPDVPGSIGWEAIFPRVVTWAKLKHIDSGMEVFIFNTHYSHVSDLARRKSMEFMSEQIKKIAGDAPVIVTGDFNIRMDGELYTDMADRFLTQNNLQNVLPLAPPAETFEHPTANGFQDENGNVVIDHIFISDHFDVKKYSVDVIKRDSIFISDHWPVKAVLITR